MLKIVSTNRPKRVARDLRDALSEMGHPTGYARCLEISSRMMGHPSYGMLARAAGHAGRDRDDSGVPADVVRERRAFQASVLAGEGIPSGLHDSILDRIRPTGRSRERRGPMTGRSAIGCAILDAAGAPGGWACLAGGSPHRFSDLSDLDPSATWWTSLDYERAHRSPMPGPHVLHGRFLPLSPSSALEENGLAPDGATAAKAAAGYADAVIGRYLQATGVEGVASSDRSLISALTCHWKTGGTKASYVVEDGRAWESFVATSARMPKGGAFETFRMSRVPYARLMLDTLLPSGACERVSLKGIPGADGRRRWIEDEPGVAFVRFDVGRPRVAGPAIFGGLLWSLPAHPGEPEGERPWLAMPLYHVLAEAYDLTPVEALVASDWKRAGEFLSGGVTDALASADGGDWADGIFAEAVWRSGLSANRMSGTVPGQPWDAGRYLRDVDFANMSREAARLDADGMAVSAYGTGWVRHLRLAA